MVELMDSQLFKAAMVGDIRFLDESINTTKHKSKTPTDYWLRSTSQKNNVIHIAASHNTSADFIREALKRFSITSLIKQENIDGDTTLHLAMRKGNVQIVEAILDTVLDVSTQRQLWSVQNMNGDTPLHIALAKQRDDVWVDFVLAKAYYPTNLLLNNSNESSLHLYVGNFCHEIPQSELKEKAIKEHIRVLIKANKSCACIKDIKGLTPLLQATKNGCLSAVGIIVEECPESVEIRDPNGSTFLHLVEKVGYLQFKGLLDMDMIKALMNSEDNEGNTPLHLAIRRRDVLVVKALLEYGADITVKNKEGVSASNLFESDANFFGNLVCTNLLYDPDSSAHLIMKERIENCMGKRVVMKDSLYKAVVKGKLVNLLRQIEPDNQSEEDCVDSVASYDSEETTEGDNNFTEFDFLSRTLNGSNIIHLAIKHGHFECVKKAIEHFPHLIVEVDSNGDCPIHIAAMFNNPASENVVDCYDEFYSNKTKSKFVTSTPFEARNSRGNTPLHEALRTNNYNFAGKVIQKYPGVVVITNHASETPLHMIARYGSSHNSLTDELTEVLITANNSIAYARDVDGFTPLLRAVHNGKFGMSKTIIDQCPQSVDLCDLKDRTMLHHLVLFIVDTSNNNNNSDAIDFLVFILHVYPPLRILRAKQDTNGETPLHYAIKKGDLVLAKIIFEMCYETQNIEELYMVDNQGNSILSLLASHPDNFLPMSMKMRKNNWIMELKLMDDKIYNAAVKGDLSTFINECNDYDDLLCQTYEGSNVIHLAIKANDSNGIEEAFKIDTLSMLRTQRDCNGETPVHIAAKFKNSASEILIKDCLHHYEGVTKRTFGTSTLFLAQNSTGNSPLHEALAASNYEFAIQLIRSFGLVALVTNHIGETPLHIFARCGTNTGRIHKEIVKELIKADGDIAYKRDKDGLTPLLRAAKSGRLWLCRTIISFCAQALEIRDLKGRSMLHHCVHYKSIADDETDNGLEAIKSLWEEAPGLDSLRVAKDMDGNTPLHYAIKEKDISLAYILVEQCVKASAKQELFSTDIQGNTVLHLLALHPKSSVHIAMKEKIESCIGRKVLMKNDLYEKIVKRELNEHLANMDANVDWSHDLLYLFDKDLSDGIDEGAMDPNIDWSHDLLYLFEEENDNGTNSNPTTIDTDNELISRAADGSNILHLAIKHRSASAAAKVFDKRPYLILQTDANGDNPLHIAARFRNNSGIKVLKSLKMYYETTKEKFRIHPFQMKNLAGDTPLHEALRTSNMKVTEVLMELDPYTTLTKNNVGETPLHLFAKYGTYTQKETLDAFEAVLNSDAGQMAASIRDIEGFSPLLRAVQSGRIQVAWLIAHKVPGAIEVCDFKGRTMLHHLRIHANEMVETSMRGGEISLSDFFDGVDSLRTARDLDGNTPLHYNLKSGNFATARLLMERCASSDQRMELTMLNNDGESILDLLRIQIVKLKKDGDGNAMLELAISQADVLNMNELIVKDLDSKKMKKKLYDAAVNGDTTIFNGIKGSTERRKIREHHLARTSDGSNIIHLALRHGKKDIIEKALHHFPELIFQRDYNFDTPTHVAARNYKARKGGDGISDAAKVVIDKAEECRSNLFNRNTRSWIPYVWDLRNSQGNTPLHEAVRSGSLKSVRELVDIIEDSECETSDVISMANNEGETPLHVYARYAVPNKKQVQEIDSNELQLLIGDNKSILYMRDRGGLTPLLRAAESGNFELAEAIWKIYPQAMQLRDTHGRTFLHLMDLSNNIISKSSTIFDINEIDALRAVQDDDGNTPLHFAIKFGKYKKAKILMQRSVDANDRRELYLTNHQGESVETLLAQDDVPNEVINVFKKFNNKYTSDYELRSSYGITRKQIKERADSLSVIAALLATITFAAAFTVPGGLDQSIGIPIFIRKILFKAFMFLDTLAMCGSMLVLYCLVWVMIGSKKESFFLVDMAIILLQGSFMATILAFGAGVFITTQHEIKWLAILVMVLCGALTFLLNRTILSLLTQFLMDNWVTLVNRFFYIPLSKMIEKFQNLYQWIKRGAAQNNE